MRICVVHLISFLIVILPLLLNSYYVVKNYPEQSEFSETYSLPKDNALKDIVTKSVSAHSIDIYRLSAKLKEINTKLKKKRADTSMCNRNLCRDQCNTSMKINYADVNLGAQVQNVEAQTIDPNYSSGITGLRRKKNPPINLLQSDMSPGNCYAFKGRFAELEIRLAEEIFVDMIEIQHIPKCRSPIKDISSAPRNFSVYGISANAEGKTFLGSFEFSNKKSCQTYEVPVGSKFQTLRFKFETNHGNKDYTCVYRIAVYGYP